MRLRKRSKSKDESLLAYAKRKKELLESLNEIKEEKFFRTNKIKKQKKNDSIITFVELFNFISKIKNDKIFVFSNLSDYTPYKVCKDGIMFYEINHLRSYENTKNRYAFPISFQSDFMTIGKLKNMMKENRIKTKNILCSCYLYNIFEFKYHKKKLGIVDIKEFKHSLVLNVKRIK